MKRLLVIVILFATTLSFFAGCEVPRDPNVLYEDALSEELKEEIYGAVLAKDMHFRWYQPKPYLGTITGCIILITRYDSIAFETHQEVIADCKFTWGGPFYLYAYRDGEVCYLREAYEKGWLAKEHIEQIHAKHVEIGQNWQQIYLEWRNLQNEPDSRDPNILYIDHLSEELKARIRSDILYYHDHVVKWDYVDPYYGTINGCIVVVIHPLFAAIPKPWTQEIAGYTYEWDNPIDLYVFRKGVPAEACELREAYEKDWLTKEQIGIIHERHEEYRANFPQMLEQWQKDQKETQGE